MKKLYNKPQIEYILFDYSNTVASSAPPIVGISGISKFESDGAVDSVITKTDEVFNSVFVSGQLIDEGDIAVTGMFASTPDTNPTEVISGDGSSVSASNSIEGSAGTDYVGE